MKPPRHSLLSGLLALVLVTGGAGPARAADPVPNPNTPTRSLFVGLGAGTVGFLAGFIIGANAGSDGSGEFDGLAEGLVLGSVAGGLLLPLGVHAGNGSRGNGLAVMATSVGIGLAGWALTLETENGIYLPLTAMAQLAACTTVEYQTARSRQRAEASARVPAQPTISIGPSLIEGRPGLLVTGTF